MEFCLQTVKLRIALLSLSLPLSISLHFARLYCQQRTFLCFVAMITFSPCNLSARKAHCDLPDIDENRRATVTNKHNQYHLFLQHELGVALLISTYFHSMYSLTRTSPCPGIVPMFRAFSTIICDRAKFDDNIRPKRGLNPT